jgi:hypothetical protein
MQVRKDPIAQNRSYGVALTPSFRMEILPSVRVATDGFLRFLCPEQAVDPRHGREAQWHERSQKRTMETLPTTLDLALTASYFTVYVLGFQ